MMITTRNMGLGSALPGVDLGISLGVKPNCFEAANTLKRCGFWDSLWSPECIMAKQIDAACQLLDADTYQQREYGTVPLPNPTTVPVIKAPQTETQMTVPGQWTPDQSTPDPQTAADKLRDQIKAAEAAGTYTPYGSKGLMNLLFGGDDGKAPPKLQEFWAEYKWWVIGGAAAVLAVMAVRSGTAAGRAYVGVRGYGY